MNTKDFFRDSCSSLAKTSASFTFSDNDSDNSLSSDALFPDCDTYRYIEKLSETKYPVYLVSCNQTNNLYAIKLFYWDNDEPSSCYTRELRFAEFTNANIVRIVDHKEEQEIFDIDVDSLKVSYILMEYAQHGDFFDALITRRIPFNEVLIRTYFRQLISGMEVLHSKGAAHLDIKLENLLIGDDYTLKLTDFDLSYLPEDDRVTTRGTQYYRAPEIAQGTCEDPYAADIYSAAITLFVLKTGGRLTFTEAERLTKLEGGKVDWNKKCEKLGERSSFFSEEFKELFTMMTKPNPKERATIAEIKKSSWFNMEVYSQEQVESFMSEKFDF